VGGRILMKGKEKEGGWKYAVFFIIIALLVGVFSLLYKPSWKGPGVLKVSYPIFGVSLLAVILVWAIGGFLYKRWINTGKKNITTFSWSIAFFVFSITFLGLLFESLGFSWANSKLPSFFFLYRQSMILFITLMYFGIIRVLTKSRFWNIFVTWFIFIISYVWFYYGLFVRGDIEFMMYGFLCIIFIPVLFLIGGFFYDYGIKENLDSMKLLAGGFLLMGLSYMGWAPWHKNYFYFLMFCLFVVSLIIIFIGFTYLSLTKVLEKSGRIKKK
jgi:hypothetical protein